MPDLMLYIPASCPRLAYTCEVLMADFAGLDIAFLADESLNGQYKLHVVDSGQTFVYDSVLFFNTHHCSSRNFNWPQLLSKDYAFDTDWLGACFYLLSRMEEYDCVTQDHHGRFPWQASVAYQYGFMQTPLVDDLAKRFISKFWPHKAIKQSGEPVLPTLDIDMSHAYKGRPFWRLLPALCKAALKGDLAARLRVLRGKAPDPYDNFAYQLALFRKVEMKAHYFFQVGGYSKYDKNVPITHALMRSLLQAIRLHHHVGLHPSYYHIEHPLKIQKERSALAKGIGRPVQSVRFHFLRFRISETFPKLIDHGFCEEHSMGYAETIGFRASTCRPYYWFDLYRNKKTELRLIPFCAMDVALQYYLKFDVPQAKDAIAQLQQTVKQYKGCFSFCFHNESLSEQAQWIGWRSVFEFALGKGGGK